MLSMRRTSSLGSMVMEPPGVVVPAMTETPPVRVAAKAFATAAEEPENSMVTSAPRPWVRAWESVMRLAGWQKCPAPKRVAGLARWGSRSQAMTSAAPRVRAMAAAVRPRTPQPRMATVVPSMGPARRKAAATVATAQFAGAAMASERDSGNFTMPVPGVRMQHSAKPPLNSRPGAMELWPYLKRCSHFCGSPRRQKKQWPQEAARVQVMRSPSLRGSPRRSMRGAPGPKEVMRPTISWPRMQGVGSWRRPCQVWRSLPQMVLHETSTRISPLAGAGMGNSRRSKGWPWPEKMAASARPPVRSVFMRIF